MAEDEAEAIARKWVEECTGSSTDVGKGLRQIIAKLDWHIKMDELEWPPYEEEAFGGEKAK